MGDPDSRENIADDLTRADSNDNQSGAGDSAREDTEGRDHAGDERRGKFEKTHSTENIRSKEESGTTTSEASTEATTATTSTP